MLNYEDLVVPFKVGILDRVLPADSVVVYGDMYIVEGGYTEYCATHGAKSVTLVDTLETPNWQKTRLAHPNIDFCKGDFANPLFMQSISDHFNVGVAFDILLHQPPFLSTLHLLVKRVADAFVIVQPMLEEQALPNSVVFLPGNLDRDLYPHSAKVHDYKAFDIEQVNQTHWIWGMTPSFMRSALASEGFEIVHQELLRPLPNPRWNWWGCVAQRRTTPDGRHWSQMRPTPGLYQGGW